jgi:hypothetical protein
MSLYYTYYYFNNLLGSFDPSKDLLNVNNCKIIQYKTVQFNDTELYWYILFLKVFNPDKVATVCYPPLLIFDMTFSQKQVTSIPVCRSNHFCFIALIMVDN